MPNPDRDRDFEYLYPSLFREFKAADKALQAPGSIESRLLNALDSLTRVDRSELPQPVREDLDFAIDAITKATRGDNSGITQQYVRLVNTTPETGSTDRIFFTIWNRVGEECTEPCVLLCRVNGRNLDLLNVTRSRPFVETVVNRLGATSYPEAVLKSRMQGVEILLSAGVRPHVLFADFVLMPSDSGLDPASAGGLLFNSFGDLFLEQMPLVQAGFPNVADWLNDHDILTTDSVRFLTTAHVQAHDLCGHSVPYGLKDATRATVDWFLRAPLEELYADTQAMWIYSAPQTRSLLANVLTETELIAIPLMIAMKRLTFYALKNVEDFDARCSWTMFGYWRKAGLIRRPKSTTGFVLNIDVLPETTDQMLSDILRVEQQIGAGTDAYDAACRAFSYRFGYENPLTQHWEIPDELANVICQ